MTSEKKWLCNLLKDGTLKDNQEYKVSDQRVFDRYSQPISCLVEKGNGKHSKFWNDNEAVWQWLYQLQDEISPSNLADNLKLFGSKEYEHNSDSPLFELNGVSWDNFHLQTGNLIGHLKKDAYELKITSRFGDDFLKYMISDSEGFVELENLGGHNNGGDLNWLLVYLWAVSLKKAYRLGLPKSYVKKNERTAKPRGALHLSTYLQDKEIGQYQCTYREHSYATEASVLISETFKALKGHSFLESMHSIKSMFVSIAEGKKLSISQYQSVKPFSNPYYQDYNKVLELSKKILAHQLLAIEGDSLASGFLFDVSMLFEYYIKKLLKSHGCSIHDKTSLNWKIPSGRQAGRLRGLEPDLVFDYQGKRYVYDVKYKHYDLRDGVKREDLFQLHTYLGQGFNSDDIGSCGLIFPILETKWLEHLEGDVIVEELIFAGRSIPFKVCFLKVPDSKDNFRDRIRAFEKELIVSLF